MLKNAEELEKLVVGQKIAEVRQVERPTRYNDIEKWLEIELKNGTTVQMVDSYECCAFTELNKFLINFENIEHVITGVSTENNYETWHIYAAMGDVLTLDVGYDPSNGYYGYGFEINVVRK
jgi:hypothetical protein